MDDIIRQKLIEKYQIQYKHPDFAGSGTFVFKGVVYIFIWQHYNYQYLIYPVNTPDVHYTICTEPDKLTTELFFSTFEEMIRSGKYHQMI